MSECVSVPVNSADEFERLKAVANGRRTGANTNAGHNPRTHCIVTVTVEAVDFLVDCRTFGQLTFVDLAVCCFVSAAAAARTLLRLLTRLLSLPCNYF